MKKKLFVIILIFISFIICYSHNLKDGVYVGYEEILGYDENSGKWKNFGEFSDDSLDLSKKWYHINTLEIHNDSVYLSKEPVYIRNSDTIKSASDGAFYYYYGIIKKEDSTIYFIMKLDYCDYCPYEAKNVNGKWVLDSSIYEAKKYKIETKGNQIIFDSVGYISQ